MSAKPPTSPRTLAEINKQIIEIKKKIQLSEGQRKAAFEEYETERKINADQILKLKKEVKELTVSLQTHKDEKAVHRVRSLRLETIVGPLVNKTAEQVKETLDLQIIDQKKQLDLIRHRKKQRQAYLAKLAKEYQVLLSEKPKKEVSAKLTEQLKKPEKKIKSSCSAKQKKEPVAELDNPYKKKTYALQNNIHRVEVQWREAEHLRNSYRTIRNCLLKDSGRFESTLQQLEERLQVQQKDIQHLQNISAEAARTRAGARGTLEREERASVQAGRVRERQGAERRGLVTDRRAELERLERRIFQSGRAPTTGAPARPDTADDTEHTGDEITPEDDEQQEMVVSEAFDKLKLATGATSAENVLGRYQAQKETKSRLDYLKKTTEAEKRQLELKQEALSTELERFKFAQERDKEKYSEDILDLKEQIDEQSERKAKFDESCREQESLLEAMCKILYNLYIGLKDIGMVASKEITANPEHGQKLVETLCIELENLMIRQYDDEAQDEEEKENNEEIIPSDDDMVPPSYNALMRRTPMPLQGHSVHIPTTPAAISEDEEEVPSRGFLKRQAQLVVDAKSRRKALRVPMSRK